MAKLGAHIEPPMDCREFRKSHVAFVDDVLPAAEMRAMERHRASCSGCSRHDTSIRRSLLLVRNLPSIEPSPDFMVRLNQRLDQLGPAAYVDLIAPRPYHPSLTAFAALAAGLVAVGYLAIETTHYFAPSAAERQIVPLATMVPALEPSPAIGSAAFVASVPTGMPVWPAMLMAGQAPMHFANLDFRDADLAR
jgi:hypothetical protein